MQYAAKGSFRKDAEPDDGKFEEIGVEKVMWVMRGWMNDEEMGVEVHVDSDCANGSERKWTSRGVMMMNGTVVQHWSRTQASCALSTAEAVILRGHRWSGSSSREAVDDDGHGVTTQVRAWTESNRAKAMASRSGVGNTRHVQRIFYGFRR